MYIIFVLILVSEVVLGQNEPTFENCLRNTIRITRETFLTALNYYRYCQELANTLQGEERENYLKILQTNLQASKEDFLRHIIGKADDVHYMIQAFNDISSHNALKSVPVSQSVPEYPLKNNQKNTKTSKAENNEVSKCEPSNDKSRSKTNLRNYYFLITLSMFILCILVLIITFLLARLLWIIHIRTIVISDPPTKVEITQAGGMDQCDNPACEMCNCKTQKPREAKGVENLPNLTNAN